MGVGVLSYDFPNFRKTGISSILGRHVRYLVFSTKYLVLSTPRLTLHHFIILHSLHLIFDKYALPLVTHRWNICHIHLQTKLNPYSSYMAAIVGILAVMDAVAVSTPDQSQPA